MNVTKKTFPALHKAFVLIEHDNGGHLIGTVYPGERKNLRSFPVPAPWQMRAKKAEVGLRSIVDDPELFDNFVIGEESEQEMLLAMHPELKYAQEVLNAYFNGWE